MHKSISRNKARNWRKGISSNIAYMRTLQFPLETEGCKFNFKDFKDLYNIIHGTGKGSLTGLICALHLSGFRFFGNNAGAQNLDFMKSTNKSAKSFTPLQLQRIGCKPEFTPFALKSFLMQQRRRGKDYDNSKINDKTLEKGKKELKKLMFSETETKKDKQNTTADKILNDFFTFLKSKYTIWKEIKEEKNIKEVFNYFIKLLNKLLNDRKLHITVDFSALEKFKSSLPKNSTIAFDKSIADKINLTGLENHQYLPHLVVAKVLKRKPKDLKTEITSKSYNTLSWLFNIGLDYWQKHSLDEICQAYNIPTECRENIANLKQWFDEISLSKNIFEKGLSEHRSDIGGTIGGWVSNYAKRLEELDASIEKLKGENAIFDFSVLDNDIQDKLEFTLQELTADINFLIKDDMALRSLKKLRGESDLPTLADINNIESYIESNHYVYGNLQRLKEAVSKHYKEKIPPIVKKNVVSYTDNFEKISRLNKFSGGTPNIDSELALAKKKFNALLEIKRKIIGKIIDWAKETGNFKDILSVMEQKEDKKIRDSKEKTKNTPLEQAKRKIWQKLINLSRNEKILADIIYTRLKELNLFTKKVLNSFLINKNGFMYKSPYSNRKMSAHKVNAIFNKVNPLDEIQRIYEKLGKDLNNVENLRSFLYLEHLFQSLQLLGVCDKIPCNLVSEIKNITDVKFPRHLLMPNPDGNITRSKVINIMNTLKSEISGCLLMLTRPEFIVRTKFTIVKKNELFYVPKSKLKNDSPVWKIPDLYYKSKKYEPILDKITNRKLTPAGILQVVSKLDLTKKETKHWLIQSPHDWFINLGFKDDKNKTEKQAIMIKKGKKLTFKKLKGNFAILKAPSDYGFWLNKCLMDKTVTISDYTILYEQKYTQKYSIKNEKIYVETIPGNVDVRAHIPISEDYKNEKTFNLNSTVIGIDLGEAGLGYAVFKVNDIQEAVKSPTEYPLNPLSSGTKTIRSIRRLIKSVNRYRKYHQPRQKFQNISNNKMAKYRENVCGDIAHIIDNLCRKHKGFPVLESNVRNLASGSRQLDLVYDKVLNLYTYSGTKAHLSARQTHWMMTNAGKALAIHSELKGKDDKKDEEEQDKKSDKLVPLKLHPGRVIGAAYTSQACSNCERNPLLAFREKYGRDCKKRNIEVESNGTVKLGNGTILLMKENKEKEKDCRRQKKATPYDCRVTEKFISAYEGYRILKNQLRQPPESLRSKDTTQSQYHCPYQYCGEGNFTKHADENAAINIVRKWAAIKLGANIKQFWKQKDKSEQIKN